MTARDGSSGPSPGCAIPPGDRTPSSAASPSASRRAFAWSSARRAIVPSGPSPSATRPAAARTPTWRIPPPTSLRARRARATNGAGPTTTDPIGVDRPFERQKVTLSAGAASARGRDAERHDGVEEPGAVDVERDAALVRDRRPPSAT